MAVNKIREAWVTKSDIAYLLDLSTNTVSKHMNHADAPKANSKKRYPLATSLQYIVSRKLQDNAIKGTAARERKDKADARIAEHKAAELEGEVMKKSEFEAIWYEGHKIVAGALKAIPRKVSTWVKGKKPAQIQKYVDGLIKKSMANIEKELDELGEEL